MRVTNATWDDVRIFGTAFLICLVLGAIIRYLVVAFSKTEQKAFKLGSPRDFIGYSFFELSKRKFEMLGETYTDTSWKFHLLHRAKDYYSFHFDIQYHPASIKVLLELKVEASQEFKTIDCPYEKKIVHQKILVAMENMLSSHTDYMTIKR